DRDRPDAGDRPALVEIIRAEDLPVTLSEHAPHVRVLDPAADHHCGELDSWEVAREMMVLVELPKRLVADARTLLHVALPGLPKRDLRHPCSGRGLAHSCLLARRTSTAGSVYERSRGEATWRDRQR